MSALGPSLALLAAAALVGCSSSGRQQDVVTTLGTTALASLFGVEPERQPQRTVTREDFVGIEGPVISIRRGELGQAFVAAAARNRDTVTYQDAARRGVTLWGAAISSTTAFFYDLNGINVPATDPIVYQRPVADWPGETTRSYTLYRRDLPNETLTFRCVFGPAEPDGIEIVEISYPTVRIVERCTNGAIRFENVYWALPETGEIWRSVQWIGPRQERITIEIVQR